MTFIDFETKRTRTAMAFARPGSLALPEAVERTVRFERRSMQYANVQDASGMRVTFHGTAGGEPIAADFAVRPPAGQESLNVVVPWTRERFQLNSKHAALPCEGFVDVGGVRWAMEPDTCHAVQDFGRGASGRTGRSGTGASRRACRTACGSPSTSAPGGRPARA
jgi:hypothetical protein